MKIVLGLASTAVALAIPGAPAAGPRDGMLMRWTIDGEQRVALVIPPTSAGVGVAKHPIVFGFHGHGGQIRGSVGQMHFETAWPQAIVVYPQGLPTSTPLDPAGRLPGWQQKRGDAGNRDLKLFDAMVASLKQRFRVDGRRIYATGFSNGAIFSYLLWAERPRTVSALGVVAGRLDASERLTTSRALLAVAGRQDPILPFDLQQESIERARQANRAKGPGTRCGPYCTEYTSAAGNRTPVRTLIHPGGHVYPSWAPAQLVAFFKSHPRP